jgi:hypothetical protein
MISHDFLYFLNNGHEAIAIEFFQNRYENQDVLLRHVMAGRFDCTLWKIIETQDTVSRNRLLDVALREAVSWGHVHLTGELLDAGANPGATVWHSFERSYFHSLDAMVDALVSYGAHIFLTCPDHRLHLPSSGKINKLRAGRKIGETHERFGRPPDWVAVCERRIFTCQSKQQSCPDALDSR